mmetsp:Transcript_49888/g.160224  ORF Transcript_49888/g.160224 Transcript_49888/m.160224 type:complete len:215 (-) Transcript_49888:77-721(-)
MRENSECLSSSITTAASGLRAGLGRWRSWRCTWPTSLRGGPCRAFCTCFRWRSSATTATTGSGRLSSQPSTASGRRPSTSRPLGNRRKLRHSSSGGAQRCGRTQGSTTIPTGSWSRTARLPCGLIELQHRGGQSLYFDFGAAGQRGPSDRLTHATETYVRTLVQYVVRKQQGAHTLTHAHRAGLRPRGARGARSGIWREGGGRSAVLGSCYLQH